VVYTLLVGRLLHVLIPFIFLNDFFAVTKFVESLVVISHVFLLPSILIN
jgi:hypothetical protein